MEKRVEDEVGLVVVFCISRLVKKITKLWSKKEKGEVERFVGGASDSLIETQDSPICFEVFPIPI